VIGLGITVTHDPDAGVAYISLAGTIAPGAVVRTLCVSDSVLLDFDALGRLVGIELLDASMLHPDLLAPDLPARVAS